MAFAHRTDRAPIGLAVCLVPGGSFSLTAQVFHDSFSVNLRLWDESENPIGSSFSPPIGGQITVNGIVPASGQLVVSASPPPDQVSYLVTLDAAHVPEPSTALLTLGGSVALAMHRQRVMRTSRV